MNHCKMCNQSGIIYLEPGHIKAPCLECSFDRKLEDLEAELERKITTQEELKVRRMIREHNKRMKAV